MVQEVMKKLKKSALDKGIQSGRHEKIYPIYTTLLKILAKRGNGSTFYTLQKTQSLLELEILLYLLFLMNSEALKVTFGPTLGGSMVDMPPKNKKLT